MLQASIHDDISLRQFVIPGLTRNLVSFWIPAFAGMTSIVATYDAMYRSRRWAMEADFSGVLFRRKDLTVLESLVI